MNYYLYKDDQNIGPLSEDEVTDGLRSGRFLPNDLACRVGEQRWDSLDIIFPNISNQAHPWMEPKNEPQPRATNPFVQPAPRIDRPGPQWPPPEQAAPQAYMPQSQVQHVVHHFEDEPEGALPMVAMIAGIVVACLMILGLVPCLGWLNWFVLVIGVITKVLCWVTVLTVKNRQGRNKGIIGLILVAIALFIGGIRLVLGGGCL